MPLTPIDTRPLFRPLTQDIVALLRTLPATDWERPTVAGSWRVRDVVAHLLDTGLRTLTVVRDGGKGPAPDRPISNERDLGAFLNRLNDRWIRATETLSPRVLTDLYDRTSHDVAEFIESASLEGPARFAVSWAGESKSTAWFHIGREFTEIWHHGAQIRDAVGAAPFGDARWLHAVLDVAVRGLPHAYRTTAASAGRTIQFEVSGPSGGRWWLVRTDAGWDINAGVTRGPDATVSMSDEVAWRLLFNALPLAAAEPVVRLGGDTALGRPVLSARSVVL